MTIETKYNPGMEVWTMANNKPVCSKVVRPHFKNDYSNNKIFHLEEMLGWELEEKELIYGLYTNIHRLETELFLTKEDLINSLR